MTQTAATTTDAPIRALVVDDSEDDAFLLKAELAQRGVAIDYRRVDSELDMAAALAADDWDLVISDHNMPGFDALAALEVLKRSGRDLPFILHSGHISDQLAISAMYDGVHDVIPKGQYERMVPVIERELRGAAARRAVRQADDRIQQLSYFDKLSKLPNQNLFCTKVSDWLDGALQRGRAVRGALFVIDIDRFLRVNASFGYESGNDIICQISVRLLEVLQSDVVLARLGGDEFGVFVPGIGERASAEVFARWISKVFEAPFMKDGIELFLTPSIGIALVPVDGTQVYDLLMNAETASAQVKRRGGNGFRFYDRTMNAASAERVALEADLRHAVERDELFLEFQPVLEAASGRIVSAEALVRWNHPRLGRVPPDRFIAIADETGLIVEIGDWVLNEAARRCHAWHEAGFTDMNVSVNVSAMQFGQPRLLESVRDTLARTGLRPGCLMLEITESSLMQDAESTAGMLRALRNMGVRISVDDFGTGYSSLSYLKRFPIDVIKIDKSFVRDLCTDEEDAAIVRAIIALAHSMRRSTIAEGVETEAQIELLKRERCEYFQGYYYGRPMAFAQLLERLESQDAPVA
ncbi:GGDEF domain-containing response regulator [Nitrogeniibacter mangrovi]|uniref:GGDEF domain-containing response regulator n=1 Tax=Nitrogeniibacter mangrovi TaxID=2016596 RepID=A0A6C1B4C4_9RHOO|nr:GGDEF domain-containing response regulator [Nitrogeniibacter mangrovi]QID18283.1 GGDEF domain-containing response regulator [Nitrogeniibacter mangrovi]